MPVSHSRRLAVTMARSICLGLPKSSMHRLAENVDAVFVAVQFVVLGRGEAVRRTCSVRVHGVQRLQQRVLDLVGRGAHEGEARPPVQEVAVVGEAAAKFAVGDLAVVDVPVDEALEIAEILHLQKGPLRHAGGAAGSVKGGWGWS